MSHRIVAQMRPSPEQEPAIDERGRDIVVTAGAGTGKTRTLVARYLSLLADGIDLRSILAITFTRKAAREMRNRVRDEVRRYLERRDLESGERRRWQEIYTQLDAARISTIHSFCSEVLRAHPAEAGVDPRFEVLGDGQLSILQSRALDETMAWAADEAEVVELFSLLGEGALRGTLESLMGQRLDAEAIFSVPAESLWSVWQEKLVTHIRDFVDDGQVGVAFNDLMALRADGTLDRAEAKGDRLATPLRRLLALWDEIVCARQVEDWSAIAQRLAPLRGEMKLLGRAANWQPAQPKTTVKELQVLYDAGMKGWVGEGINLALDRQLANAAPVLRRLVQYAVSTYHRLKAERQALDFDDLEHGALALLRKNQSVRVRWQGEIKAILVDEFQDTNGRQRDLVGLLNGNGGKLFIVGDAKQSIYRFRGADVTVFRTEREKIERRGGAAFLLETSYRAHKELVQGLNNLLRPVLGEEADLKRPWAEPFAPLGHHRENPGIGFSLPHIELHLTVGTKSGGALDRAADAVAWCVLDLIERGVEVTEGDGSRRLAYSDVAILCRASRAFSFYEDALERAKVPFLTVAGRGFCDRPEVRDLLNVLQALSDPTDDLALAGLLRSPAFALSDEALFWLCQQRRQDEGSTTLWNVLQAPGEALPEVDRRRAERAVRIIANLHAQAGRTSVADLLKMFLDDTDYRAALIQSGGVRGARNATKLLADAHASGIVGVGEFLEYISGLRERGAREGEARATAEGAVQIMSIHAAKGLEFPVVVIGDATGGGGRGGSVLVDLEFGVLLPLKDEDGLLPAVYRLGKNRASDQDAAESDRLLYVVATRAREKLIFSGCIGTPRDGTIGQPGGWLGQIAGPMGLVGAGVPYDETGRSAHVLSLQVGQTPVGCTIYEPGYVWDVRPREVPEHVVTSLSLPPPLLESVSAEAVSMDQRTFEQDRVAPQRVWRVVPTVRRPRAPAWVVGSLVHEALAAWRLPDHGAVRFERWAEARARAYGITDAQQLTDAVRQSGRLLTRFQSHELYREMAGAERRLHEVPYSLSIDGGVNSGIIDAMYLQDGVWTIVEFKTDLVKDRAQFEELLAEQDYLAQAQRYLKAGRHLLGQKPRFILCLLNYARSVYLHRVEDGSGGF